MAKPKQKILIQVVCSLPHILRIWMDNPARYTQEVLNTAGVSSVLEVHNDSMDIILDPRYDKDEVIKDLEKLLTSEVPDIFKE